MNNKMICLVIGIAALAVGCAGRHAPVARPMLPCDENTTIRVFFPEDIEDWSRIVTVGSTDGRRIAQALALAQQGQVREALDVFLAVAARVSGELRVHALAAASLCALRVGDIDLAVDLAHKVDTEVSGPSREARVVRDVLRIAEMAGDPVEHVKSASMSRSGR